MDATKKRKSRLSVVIINNAKARSCPVVDAHKILLQENCKLATINL